VPRVSIENIMDTDPRIGAVFSDYDFDDVTYLYFGYVNSKDQWYIIRIDCSEEPFYTYEYTKGTTQYAKGWLHRDELIYKYYDEVF